MCVCVCSGFFFFFFFFFFKHLLCFETQRIYPLRVSDNLGSPLTLPGELSASALCNLLYSCVNSPTRFELKT